MTALALMILVSATVAAISCWLASFTNTSVSCRSNDDDRELPN